MALESRPPRVLVLRNDESELRRMSQWFRDFTTEAGVTDAKALDLELCLNELVTNVIHYAYPDDRAHEIRITLEREGTDLRVTVEDDGREFDPRQAGAPEWSASLESIAIGGWGIPIVRAFADEILYERRDGWNRLTIVSR